MNLRFFLYDLPLPIAFIIVVGSFVLISVLAAIYLHPVIKRKWHGSDNNDVISYYLSTIGVFYGIMFGLQAAGVWQNFEDISGKVEDEASAVAALYRDVSEFPDETSKVLKQELADYTYYVIYYAWPLHQQGIRNTKGSDYLNKFQKTLYQFNPNTIGQQTLFAEAMKQYNKLIELRRARLMSVDTGIPRVIWLVFLSGALVTILVSTLFNIDNRKLHAILNGLIGFTIGSVMFIVLMLDYPFRGKLSIGPDAYEAVYSDLMTGHTPQVNEPAVDASH